MKKLPYLNISDRNTISKISTKHQDDDQPQPKLDLEAIENNMDKLSVLYTFLCLLQGF